MLDFNCIAIILSYLKKDINTFALIIEMINTNSNLDVYCFPILEKIIKEIPKFYYKLEDKIKELNEMKKILDNKYKDLEELINNEIKDNNKRLELINKYDAYTHYNDEYPKLLIDALFSFCDLPFARHSQRDINFDDIKEIIRLIPETLNNSYGKLRCRDNVPPLACACFNPYVRLEIIEYLLEKGADKNKTINLNGYPINILQDLKENNNNRYTEIEKLFNK